QPQRIIEVSGQPDLYVSHFIQPSARSRTVTMDIQGRGDGQASPERKWRAPNSLWLVVEFRETAQHSEKMRVHLFTCIQQLGELARPEIVNLALRNRRHQAQIG
ncbi:hypothetical protein ACET33_34415, partial [Pseudomonas aeruginosa]